MAGNKKPPLQGGFLLQSQLVAGVACSKEAVMCEQILLLVLGIRKAWRQSALFVFDA
ncbi:hypothetical protein [Pseudomonas sp. DTU12.1]|jgi:hypothetical protein|uniref:hypothetical protein n=1 Tax=Pseudomonas sp. DTU12.1 TaxID=2654238 RepID=UPI00135AA8C9|nr:hypothetical protein [Pseudomonas sp. DTU12.1]